MLFSPFPASLALGIRKSFAWARLQATMLDLDLLRTLIDNGQEEAICKEWLHPEEQDKLDTLHYQKRHLEWLGGRICAKQACHQYLDNPVSDEALSILPHRTFRSAAISAPHLLIKAAASGRPFLDHTTLPAGLTTPHISISHSRKYAMAVAASTLCGLDIQAGSDALDRVKERFCSREEEDLLGRAVTGLQDAAHLTLLWAAKEAVKKGVALARMPGFLELTLTDIRRQGIDAPVSLAPRMDPEQPTAKDGLVSRVAWGALERLAPTADEKANFLFTLDYQEHHQDPLRIGHPRLQFQVTVGLHQGYGIGLCLLPAHSCPGANHA